MEDKYSCEDIRLGGYATSKSTQKIISKILKFSKSPKIIGSNKKKGSLQ
jgi:hypothetical protein